MSVHDLPAVNATLNALSGILLLIGFSRIRAGRRDQHRKWMLAAFAASSLFLVSYVVYHAQVGSVRFTRNGFVRPLYFTILLTHVTLAAAVLPLAIVTNQIGFWVVRVTPAAVFFRVTMIILFLISLELTRSGMTDILGG